MWEQDSDRDIKHLIVDPTFLLKYIFEAIRSNDHNTHWIPVWLNNACLLFVHDTFQILKYGIDVHRSLSCGPLVESLFPMHITSLADGSWMHGQLRPHLTLYCTLWRANSFLFDVKLLNLLEEWNIINRFRQRELLVNLLYLLIIHLIHDQLNFLVIINLKQSFGLLLFPLGYFQTKWRKHEFVVKFEIESLQCLLNYQKAIIVLVLRVYLQWNIICCIIIVLRLKDCFLLQDANEFLYLNLVPLDSFWRCELNASDALKRVYNFFHFNYSSSS